MRKLNAFLPLGMAVLAISKCQPYQPVMVIGPSMEPTLSPAQVVFGTRDFSDIQRGDLVVFEHNGNSLIKRVVGLPGDRIYYYLVGGSWELARTPDQRTFFEANHRARRTVEVPPNHLFMLGDNFIYSNDSRNFGPVPEDCLEFKIPRDSETKAVWTSVDLGHMLSFRHHSIQ